MKRHQMEGGGIRVFGSALLAILLTLPVQTAQAADDEEANQSVELEVVEEAEDQSEPWLGVLLDAGVPDGANVAAVWRPFHWLRFHGGGSYNLVGFGLRGGVSLLPIHEWITPSLVVEGGYVFPGDLDGFIADVTGQENEGLPQSAEYAYGNLHIGLEMGSSSFTFYLRGGYSLIDVSITPADGAPSDGIRVEENARLFLTTPSAKLGFIVYFL